MRLPWMISALHISSMFQRAAGAAASSWCSSLFICQNGRRYSNSCSSTSTLGSKKEAKIMILGGGLAGLATANHLLNKTTGIAIDIWDVCEVGDGGASAVAGGLLHPLSPRGKLVAFGTEGLTATNQLIKMVDDDSFILRNELYRLASSPEQLQFLKQTAENFPQIAEYIPGEKLRESQIIDGNSIVSGGLRLHNGCKVIFMPGYLKALWRSCERLAISRSSTISWRKVNTQTIDESSYDVVVYAAGSGMWSDKHEVENNFSKLPVTLVRGQSLVMEAQCKEALLCGKYISPTPNQMHTLLGATHEFRENPLSSDALITELKARTQSFVPKLWENHQILQITSGVRVQSDRGKYGRMPIIGKLSNQQDRWLFTGLSSRGLLYHGLFADVLADAILSDSEEPILQRDWLWWKKITTM